ncbi:MAG: hypothetical protein H6853_07285 [Rhodospirillales bacterium]|nr:MAG: hypothetical protein H6853_07285 [Rhodospirillales bacterium]
MTKKKNRACTPAGAQRVLGTIDRFEQTDKGQHDRGHCASVLISLLDNNMFTRDELVTEFGIRTDSLKAAFSVGTATNITETTRNNLFKEARSRAKEILSEASNNAAPAVRAELKYAQ